MQNCPKTSNNLDNLQMVVRIKQHNHGAYHQISVICVCVCVIKTRFALARENLDVMS